MWLVVSKMAPNDTSSWHLYSCVIPSLWGCTGPSNLLLINIIQWKWWKITSNISLQKTVPYLPSCSHSLCGSSDEISCHVVSAHWWSPAPGNSQRIPANSQWGTVTLNCQPARHWILPTTMWIWSRSSPFEFSDETAATANTWIVREAEPKDPAKLPPESWPTVTVILISVAISSC